MINISSIGSGFLRHNESSWTTGVSRYDLLNHNFEAGEIDLSFAYCNLNQHEFP